MRATVVLLCAALLLAGCAAPGAEPPATTGAPPTATTDDLPSSAEGGAFPPTATLPPAGQGAFPSRPYFRDPVAGKLAHEEGVVTITLPRGGFDVSNATLIHALDGGRLVLTAPSGKRTTVVVPELRHIARPSLSPDGTRAVVQATSGEAESAPPSNLDIFVVDLATGGATRIAGEPHNEESPEWSPDGTRIAYSSFSPESGVDLHVYDLATGRGSVFDEAGGIHLAFSPDGARILEAGRARILDARTGEVVADLREAIVASAAAAGWSLDTRFPGQAGRGTFPLDGDFSPDGSKLVLDGAVEDDGRFGVIVFTVDLDGSGFRKIAGPFEVDPAATNGLNYSETNPAWP